jgi:cell division septation protein DedD
MTNKQAITTFAIGVGFLLAAFWAGMTVARNSRISTASPGVAKTAGAPVSPSRADGRSDNSPGTITPTSSQPGAGDSYIVRVAAFGTQDLADKLAFDLRHKYLSAHTEEPGAGDDSLYRVDIGPYEKREEAEQVARELAVDGRKGIMIISRGKK